MLKNNYGYMSYQKLWDFLDKKKMNSQRLRELGVYPRTLSKLRKNETLSTDSLCQLCFILNCQPKDIMEYVKEDKNDVQDRE